VTTTTAPVPAATKPAAAAPRVPLPRLLRATWYRQKTALIGIFALYLLTAAILEYRYVSIRSALISQHVLYCVDRTFCPNGDFYEILGSTLYMDAAILGVALVIGLAVIFGGIRWLTREYESGGFRYTWAQAASPARWFTANWLPLTAVTIAGATVTCVAYSQWHSLVSTVLDGGNAYDKYGFFTRPAGYLSLAFAALGLGILAAATIRRTVPAMAATLAAYAALLYAAVFKLTPWLLSLHPVTTRAAFRWGQIAGNGYLVRDWWTDAAGRVVPGWQTGGGFNGAIPSPWDTFMAIGNSRTLNKWVATHHFTYWVSYQPVDRIGTFHAIWAAAFLLLGLLASGLAIWQVRSRRP
jgi:hypothetical protein